MRLVDRRQFCLLGAAAGAASLAGCAATPGPEAGLAPAPSSPAAPPPGHAGEWRPPVVRSSRSGPTISKPDYVAVYGDYPGEPFPIHAFDSSQIDPAYLRQEVAYLGPEEPGTVVIDPSARNLFFVQPGKRATRYGVGVGRDGFRWAGQARIQMRRSWPDWIPPHEMVERDPAVRAQLSETPRGLGVPGGSTSPLGARAMYLFGETGGDLGYRIHGTTEPETIGSNVSSGCIRLINQDVVNLYSRVPIGAHVVVLSA